jgi:hypothetical protein
MTDFKSDLSLEIDSIAKNLKENKELERSELITLLLAALLEEESAIES